MTDPKTQDSPEQALLWEGWPKTTAWIFALGSIGVLVFMTLATLISQPRNLFEIPPYLLIAAMSGLGLWHVTTARRAEPRSKLAVTGLIGWCLALLAFDLFALAGCCDVLGVRDAVLGLLLASPVLFALSALISVISLIGSPRLFPLVALLGGAWPAYTVWEIIY